MKLLFACLYLAPLALAQAAQPKPQPSHPLVSDGTRISVELKTTINAKKAKAGDPVKLEVTQDVRGADGQILIPSGAKLFGKVSVAVAITKQQPESQLSIVVERAEWKKGSADLNGFIVGGLSGVGRTDIVAVYVGGSQGSIAEGPAPPPSVYSRLPGEEADPRPPALSDVELKVADDPSIGSVLVSKKKDVVLESGTTFVIRHTILQKP